MINIKKMSRIFRTEEIETTALNEVDIKIDQGEFVSIMGPSGCGKSTLLNILGLLDNPSSGAYDFLGNEVALCSERQRAALRKQHIGFVFQSFNLIDELSVYENVELPLLYLNVPVGERKTRIEKVLDTMSILHRQGHFPQQLSGGQQQRVAVARAVVTNPEIILADEPTGNLDSEHGDEVMKIMTELNQAGTTIIMVTHSPSYAEYGNRVIHLFDGQVVTESNKQDFHI